MVYATATVDYIDYGLNEVTDTLDSRDDPDDTDGTTGDGDTVEIILADIQTKGLKWKSTAVDVHDHVMDVDRPNSNNLYHWQRTNNLSEQGPFPAAYIKGDAPQLEFEVQHLPGSVPVRITFGVYAYPAPAGYPFITTKLLSGDKATVNLPSLKDEVNLYGVTLDWAVECQRTDGSWATLYPPATDGRYEISGLKLYALLGTPVMPMQVPWIGVLDDSCSWAAGQYNSLDVAEKLTTGFYFSQKAIYEASRSYWLRPTSLYRFELSDFLSGTGNTNPYGLRYMDCRDISSYMCILARSQGLIFTASPYYSNPEYVPGTGASTTPGGFFTNYVCPMGSDPGDDGEYIPFHFNFHQIALSGMGNVYDATNAQRYDLSGSGFRNPPFNWPINGYWQTAVSGATTNWNPIGLVQLPNPSSITAYPGYSASQVPTVR